MRVWVGVFFKYTALLIQVFTFSGLRHFSFCVEITAFFSEVPPADYQTSMNEFSNFVIFPLSHPFSLYFYFLDFQNFIFRLFCSIYGFSYWNFDFQKCLYPYFIFKNPYYYFIDAVSSLISYLFEYVERIIYNSFLQLSALSQFPPSFFPIFFFLIFLSFKTVDFPQRSHDPELTSPVRY